MSDQRAQEIIGHAMKAGALKERNVIGVITGLMGAGKTCLLNRLFSLNIPTRYTSTGVSEKSKCALLHRIASISVGEWKLFTEEQIRIFLAPLIKSGMGENDIKRVAITLMELLDPSFLAVESTGSVAAIDFSPTESKMVSLIKEAKELDIDMLELIHMIDTGGQPQLMEVMPSLVHNANLAIVVVNLEYGLDEHPKVTYHEEDECYEEQYDEDQFISHYTGRDVILKLASTLHAKKSSSVSNNSFRLIIVATHPDKVKNLKTCVKKLNEGLRHLLLPAFEDELICKGGREIAYVLNLTEPDEGLLNDIRTKISESKMGHTLDVPSSFFLFEQDLLAFVKRHKRDILTLDECRQVGARLEMSNEVVQAALILFHRQNTFLYFQHVLPNHVFVNPRVPLDIVNDIVKFSFKYKKSGSKANFIKMLDEGIITEELLGQSEISHFKDGVYEVKDAIKLFCHTCTLAPLQLDPAGKKDASTKKKYLMMCLKPSIPESEFHKHIPESSITVPLVLKFKDDCVPLGGFSSTVSRLISAYEWAVTTILTDEDIIVPKCLFHNIATLYTPKLGVNVVLVDFSKRLEIYVYESDLKVFGVKSYPSICSQVRSIVLGAVADIADIMEIKKEQVEVSSAFHCKCSTESKKRIAVLKTCNDVNILRCKCSTQPLLLNPKHCLWIKSHSSRKHQYPPVHAESTLADSRGYAILVTCDYAGTPGKDPLPGTIKDGKEMKETLTKLSFPIRHLHNPTKEDIEAEVTKFSVYLSSYEVKEEKDKEKIIIFAFSGHGCSKGQAEKIIANDGQELDVKDEIVNPLTKHEAVGDIPKLFFIDACRGGCKLSTPKGDKEESYFEKAVSHAAGNIRFDYATIPRHVSHAKESGSIWMPKLARALRTQEDCLQVVAARVKKEVHDNLDDVLQQCESVDRLNTGPLYLN